MAERTLRPHTDLPDAETTRERETLKNTVDSTDQARVVLFPFLSADAKLGIGGWDLMPWCDSQDLSLSRDDRRRCAQWLRASKSQHSVICVRSEHAELPLEDLCAIVEYVSVSHDPWREHNCGGRCYHPIRVASDASRPDMPGLWPPCSSDTGHVESDDEDLYTALAAAFVQAREGSAECGRLRRALTFFNEAHRARQAHRTFDDFGPTDPADRTILWFIAGLGMAFEAMFGLSGRRRVMCAGNQVLLGQRGDRSAGALSLFVQSTSYFEDLRESLAATGHVAAEANELAIAAKARLEGGLDAVSATLRKGLADTFAPYLKGTHAAQDIRRLTQWFSAFYTLRCKLAHGNEVMEVDLYEKGLTGGRWYGSAARKVFRAAVVALLASQDYYVESVGNWLSIRYFDPAMQAVLTKGERIVRVQELTRQRAYTSQDGAHELGLLLGSIAAQDGDESFAVTQLKQLKHDLAKLSGNEDVPLHIRWKAQELQGSIPLLETVHRVSGTRRNRRVV